MQVHDNALKLTSDLRKSEFLMFNIFHENSCMCMTIHLLNIVTFIRVSARYIPKIEIIDDTKAGVDVSVSLFFFTHTDLLYSRNWVHRLRVREQ